VGRFSRADGNDLTMIGGGAGDAESDGNAFGGFVLDVV
jgi:hypothetical protein